MHDRLYQAMAEALVLAVQLPSGAPLPPAPELRSQILTALDAMVGKGRAAGLAETDLAEARYALVAFFDEQILKSNWVGRNEWMARPLQLELYGEYTAGENFFTRLRTLMQGPASVALEAYYLCLALGFRGVHGAAGDPRTLQQITESARAQLTNVLPAVKKLAPHAEPLDRVDAVRTSRAPLIALIAACLLTALLALGGLYWGVESQLTRSLEALSSPALLSSQH
jgi:type VI secretion system protein ImpK